MIFLHAKFYELCCLFQEAKDRINSVDSSKRRDKLPLHQRQNRITLPLKIKRNDSSALR
jgi:tRNA threonylcarbamoyladenosine modification (KEOPS) complex  Pcc1 subunit